MLLIFDWDGTLMDSAARITECMQAAAQELGLEPQTDEAVRNIIGLALPEAISELHPALGEADIDRFQYLYSQHFVAADREPSALFPGVNETLARLHERGFTLAVATGKSRRGLDRVLRQLPVAELLRISRCADETRSKPHPQMLWEILEEARTSPDNALMVGDTEYDLAMARSAAVARVGVSYGAHAVERLQQYQPEACIDRFEELERLLETRAIA